MTTFTAALNAEIRRLARKEARTLAEPLRQNGAQIRRQIASLKASIAELTRQTRRVARKADTKPVAANDPTAAMRFSAKGLHSHRTRLGLSADEMSRLIGVSAQTIYNWEQGRAKPRAAQLPVIAALRSMSKRAVRGHLEANTNSSGT